MASSDEARRCCLEHCLRSVGISSDKTKLQADEIMEMVVGKVMAMKFLPPDKLSEQFPGVKTFLCEVLAMLKSLNETMENFIKCRCSGTSAFSAIEPSSLHEDLETKKLLHPGDFAGSLESGDHFSETQPPSITSVQSVTGENAVVHKKYNVNCPEFVPIASKEGDTHVYPPGFFVPTSLHTTGHANLCYYVTSSVQSPIPSVIPMPLTPYPPQSAMLRYMPPLPQGAIMAPLSMFPIPAEAQLVAFDETQGPTIEVRCEERGAVSTVPFITENLQNAPEGSAFEDVLGGSDEPESIQNHPENKDEGVLGLTERFSGNALNAMSPSVSNAESFEESCESRTLSLEDNKITKLLCPRDILEVPVDPNGNELSRASRESLGNERRSSQSSHTSVKNEYGDTVVEGKPGCANVESECSNASVDGEHKNSNVESEHSYANVDSEQSCSRSRSDSGSQELKRDEIIPLNKLLDVYLAFLKPPNRAWIQLGDCRISELQTALNKNISEEGVVPFDNLYTGLLVAARYAADGLYYRAVITKLTLQGKEAEILFIDFGNMEVIKKEDLSLLALDFVDIPAMGFLCLLTHLDGVELKSRIGLGYADLIKELEAYSTSGRRLKAVFETLPEGVGYDPLPINCPKYSVSLFSGTAAYEAAVDGCIDRSKLHPLDPPVQMAVVSRAVSDNENEQNSPKNGGFPTTEDVHNTGSREESSSESAAKVDPGSTGLSRSCVEILGESQRKALDWNPLPEEEMNSSGDHGSSGNVWSSLLRKAGRSTMYTMGADRQLTKYQRRRNSGFKNHSWESASALGAEAVSDYDIGGSISVIPAYTLPADIDSSISVVPAYALPAVDLIKPKVPVSDAGALIPVQLCHVEHPHLFYVYILDSETSTLEEFHRVMSDYYETKTKPLNTRELPNGSFWAVRGKDGDWYRAMVLANKLKSSEKGGECRPEVTVRYVDYGKEVTVLLKDVRGLHENFTLMHMLAIPCALTHVYPIEGWKDEAWPPAITEAFITKCGGMGAKLFAHFKFHDSNTDVYNVILKTTELEVINKFLVDSGLATSDLLSLPVGEVVDDGDTDSSKDAVACDWDPMATAYLAEDNNANIDDECAETVLFGIKNTDETRLCKFYREGKVCPRGETCRWEHTRLRDGVTTLREPVYYSCTESLELPKCGSLLSVNVTHIVSPSCFYLYFPLGLKDLRAPEGTEEDNGGENLEKFEAAMCAHYQYSLPQPNAVLPATGELKVVCRGRDDFSRGRILGIRKDFEATLVKVFFIDYGAISWVREQQLRNLAPQFSHMAPQAVESFLEGVDKPEGGWDDSAAAPLRNMTENLNLVAHVKSFDNVGERLGIHLYNTETEKGKDIDINKEIKEMFESKL